MNTRTRKPVTEPATDPSALSRTHRIRDGFTKVSGLFAFWRYDTFPYVLGGPVMAIDERGYIQAETYGGSVFKPIKIVSRAAGAKLLAQIESLRRQQYAAERAFHDEWRSKIVELLPEASKEAAMVDYMKAAK